jgi:NAD(P)-dependent dehydrogenase (short-subunit alcohol dehydrogenase family)
MATKALGKRISQSMKKRILPVDLPDLRVLITAAGSGIGRTIAASFFARSARVFVCDVDAAALEATLAELDGVAGEVTDISDPAAVDRMVAKAAEALGGLDVLVNNAGIAGPTAGVEEIDPVELDRTTATNLHGQFYCCRRAVPLLREAGGGAIINLGSVASRLGYPLRSPYAATKWGVVGFTKSLAIELGPDNIRVNAILPGHVDTDRFRRVVAAKAAALGKSVEAMTAECLGYSSLGRTIDKEDIANMALYLASPFGEMITAQAISICGNVEMLR